MGRPIRVEVRCRNRTPEGIFSGVVEITIDRNKMPQLEFTLQNPLEANIDLRVSSGGTTLFHLQGDENIGRLEEQSQMLLYLLSEAFMKAVAILGELTPDAARTIELCRAQLEASTGLGEFFAIGESSFDAGDREADLMLRLLTTS